MATYVAVFQGRTIAEAKMVATTAHPAVIAAIAEEFLRHTELSDDPVLRALLSGERRALRLIGPAGAFKQEPTVLNKSLCRKCLSNGI
jgi:hypothetical protein